MSLSDVSDEDLVLRARAGDKRAFGALFDRHAARLARLGRRHLVGALKRREGESDLVQDTLLSAFRALGRFEPRGPGSFARWLDAILEHKADDLTRLHLRGRRSVRREVGGLSGVQPPDPGPTPSTNAVRGERVAAMREAVARMDDEDRLILTLIHSRGATFVEAGRLMGRTADAARKHYSRVVARLARGFGTGGAP